MEAIDLLLSRRSVLAGNLTEPGPNPAELKTILTAGLRVPDHGRVEPWRIQVLEAEGQAALARVLGAIHRRENPGATEKMVEAEAQRALKGPVMLVVTSHPNPEKFEKVPLMEQKASCGALCQNILLAAHALGFAAQWLTGWPAYHPKVKRALGHDPETEIVGFIHIGTPAEPPTERKRPVLEEIVSEWTGS